MAKKSSDDVRCSFCGKGTDEVSKLVSGPGTVYICDGCVELCSEAMDDNFDSIDFDTESKDTPLILPKDLHKKLNEYVIGQEHAKKVLSVAVYNHYKRLRNGGKSNVELEKSNILLVGPTGTGKTLLARTLAKLLDVPFAISDATTLTEAGYVGEDVENVVLKLVQNAGQNERGEYNIERAERGIIFIDEIDKISRKGDSASITRDVSGEGVQQALLKIIEGTIAAIPAQGGRKHPHQEYIHINTNNILFICSGAFDGLEEIVKRRLGKRTLGFGTDISNDRVAKTEKQELSKHDILRMSEPEDFIKYGLIPEFVGRLPVVSTLEDLDEAALVKVLTEPSNALIKQYTELLDYDKVKLTFTDDALYAIAKLAIKRKSGARGLRAILESTMLDVMYKTPSLNRSVDCIITADVINNKAEPEIVESTAKSVKGAGKSASL